MSKLQTILGFLAVYIFISTSYVEANSLIFGQLQGKKFGAIQFDLKTKLIQTVYQSNDIPDGFAVSHNNKY